MRFVEDMPNFSPSDLTGSLACDHFPLKLRAMVGELVVNGRQILIASRELADSPECILEQVRDIAASIRGQLAVLAAS